MTNRVSQSPSDDELYQLSKEQLVETIKTLQKKIARLEENWNLDSKISSKPPSSDLLKKSEKEKLQPETDGATTKRKPGGQPGHQGKTRKGFGRIDRFEILRPQLCSCCGSYSLGVSQ
jgi:transposase